MSKLLKSTGLLLLVGGLVWLVSLWQWHNTGRDVQMADIVLQLLVLPVVLAGVLLFALWAVPRMRASVQAPSTAGVPVDSARASAAASADEAPVPTAWLVAEALNTPLGLDAGDVLSTLIEGPSAPGLDPTLTDSQGLPIFSARGAVPDGHQDIPPELLEDDDPAWPALSDGQPWSLAARRALLRLEPVIAQLVDAVQEHLRLAPVQAWHDAGPHALSALNEGDAVGVRNHLSGVARPVTPAMVRQQADRAPVLTVRLLLPAAWRPAEREQAVQWVRERAAGLLDWAQAQQAQGIRWVHEPLSEPDALWRELNQLLLQWSRDPRPQACLLLATDSALDPDRVAQWEAAGQLFTADHQHGRVPGEAAAGLLLAHPTWPAPHEADDEAPRLSLSSPLVTRRDKSADAVGRIGHRELLALLQAAWPRLTVPTPEVLVLADADHRASRASELYEAVVDAQPEIDPDTQVLRAGVSLGDMGEARGLLATALAAAAARQGRPAKAVLTTLLQHSHERVLIPVWRVESDPAASPSGTPTQAPTYA